MPTDAQLRLEGAYKVVEWMRVRNQEGHGSYDVDGLKCDLDHSALLHWLCHGNEPLPERPPVRFSRPDHRAAQTGRFDPRSVDLWPGQPSSLIVDQESWKLLETKGPEEWMAAHRVKSGNDSAWSAPWSIRRDGDGWVAERLRRSVEKPQDLGDSGPCPL
jgi:hypothetical protein